MAPSHANSVEFARRVVITSSRVDVAAQVSRINKLNLRDDVIPHVIFVNVPFNPKSCLTNSNVNGSTLSSTH